MGIFLRHSWNVKPPRWGSPADVQYAIKINAEKIYQVDPDSIVLVMPLFWGLPPLDYSGNNNHGVNHGATYKDGSLDFDGANDYVRLTNTFSNNVGSVEAWVNFRTNGSEILTLVTDSNNNASYLQFMLYSDNTLSMYSFSVIAIKTVATLNMNTWYHVVFQSDGTNTKIFVNGVDEVLTVTTGNGKWTNDVSTNAANIGALHRGTQQYDTCDGFIGEVRVSDVAFSADQIALFHALPYGLYQSVSRPIWLIPAVATTPSPTTLAPTTPSPTTVAPTTPSPTTVSPTTTAPTTSAPTPSPTTLPPTTLPPTTVAPTTLPPTTLTPTTTEPTSLPPTTLEPTTLPPTTLAPTTAPPTTLQPTTLGPTTIAPTTLPPTTLAPTTDIPEAICIKTCDSLITSEIICYAMHQ